MGTPVYYFDDFCLHPLARELTRNGEPVTLAASAFDCLVYLIEHRERPVGRDELISAVWGRADVSDNLLAQTIVRLRRALDDAGSEQRCIKTVARVGYRWMLDVRVVQEAAASVDERRGNDAAADAAPKVWRIRRSVLLALLATFLIAVVYGGWQMLASSRAKANFQFNRSAAIVLPVDVNAPDDWKWLHLGMMDMIATRLRAAKVPTESSQAVLELLKDSGDASSAMLSSFVLVVHPRAELSAGRWRVHLDARSQDGRTWNAEASSGDVLDAARVASDLLLAQLGYSAGSGDRTPRSSNSVAEYMQRVDAARLAGQPQVARELIEKAPQEVRNSPELIYLLASLDCDEGKADSCEQRLAALLKQLPAQREPVLRGQILTVLGAIYRNQHRSAESAAALEEAVHILEAARPSHGQDAEALSTAYLNRAFLNELLWKLEEATADLGRARMNYAVAGDLVGVAKTDFAMGILAIRRAQPDAAVTLLQHAYEQFVSMGMRSMLLSTLDGLAYAQQMLLKFSDELSTTDRFWPLDEKRKDFGFVGVDMIHELTMVRAAALADNGRTGEAKALLEGLLHETDVGKEAGLRATVYKNLARLALDHGDDEPAAALAASALGPEMEKDDQRDYAETWLMRISALQRIGKRDDARHDIAAMLDWESRLPVKDDWTHIYVMRAMAAQAWIDGSHDKAIEQLKQAMSAAEKLGVPEVIVSVGKAYAMALLDARQVDQAVAVSGRLSNWSNVDWRAAWVEARVYQALGQADSWEKSRLKAQQLAGDRPLPKTSASFEF